MIPASQRRKEAEKVDLENLEDLVGVAMVYIEEELNERSSRGQFSAPIPIYSNKPLWDGRVRLSVIKKLRELGYEAEIQEADYSGPNDGPDTLVIRW